MPRVPHKKNYTVSVPRHQKNVTQRKCTVSWPRGYSKTKNIYKDQIQFFFTGSKTKSVLYYRG